MKQNSLITASLLLLMAIISFLGYNAYQRNGLEWRKSLASNKFEGDVGHLRYHQYMNRYHFSRHFLA